MQRWLELFGAVIKPSILLGLALLLDATFAAVHFPLTGSVFVNLAAWFALGLGLVALLVWTLRRRTGALEVETLSELLFSLLATLGAGPFAALLFTSAAGDLRVIAFAIVAAVLAVQGTVKLARLFVRSKQLSAPLPARGERDEGVGD